MVADSTDPLYTECSEQLETTIKRYHLVLKDVKLWTP